MNSMYFPLRGLFLLMSSVFMVIPLLVTLWVLLKIQSIDATLKEISRKLDKPASKDNQP